jgi:hypothetical protein
LANLRVSFEEAYEKFNARFKADLFSILGDSSVNPYMTFDHGRDAWDAFEAKFGVSNTSIELYVGRNKLTAR